jgi:hypothetical protein
VESTSIDAQKLATKIQNDPNYTPGEPIILYSCETGKGQHSIAQALANTLNNGSTVTAPNDYLHIDTTYDSNGSANTTFYVGPENANAQTGPTTGQWITFSSTR